MLPSRLSICAALVVCLVSSGCGGGGGGGNQSSSSSSSSSGGSVVGGPVITAFQLVSSGVSLGDSSALTWDVSNATSLSIDQGVGAITGKALVDKSITVTTSAVGDRIYTLTATNAKGSTTAQVRLVTWPATVGINADRPPFMTERNGAFRQAWGGGGHWPQQLFWEDASIYKTSWNDMVVDADSIDSGGLAPAIGCVAWGFDLILGNGGDAANGIADYSAKPEFKRYSDWMNARKDDYFAVDAEGKIAYPGQGYISFGMPMLPADISNGAASQTFGEWAGERVGKLALNIHCRSLIGADGFIGLNYFTDSHPRLINAFEKWANVTVPGNTVAERSSYITKNFATEWWDFAAHNQSTFFVTAAKTILAGGRVPLVGGQYPNIPAIARFFGDDPLIWAQHIDPKYLFFYVENQSAGDRDTPPQWTSVASLGATASRCPDVAIGAFVDADQQDYWGAVERAKLSRADGYKYLKHVWLSSAWAHVANSNGSVRRAAQVMVRSYWDAGGVDADMVQTYLAHIPKHPFGPALYYSLAIERSFEAPPPPNTDTPNYYYQHWYILQNIATPTNTVNYPQIGSTQGINIGYWVGDTVDISKLAAADIPSAWLVYNLDRLPAAEKSRLQAIAPVIDPRVDPAAVLAAGPVRVKGSGLNCLAFVDQSGSVIVLVSNVNPTSTTGSLEFTKVGNGTFSCKGLLGTPNAALTVANNAGSFPITVAERDTVVFEIPGLKWIGHTP
ncbi:MAG: hypothetical protein IPP19_04125 [Verrucomicrobia bacterium]|nr:hypothetical protein [Verrucomicrobiota bacterium]